MVRRRVANQQQQQRCRGVTRGGAPCSRNALPGSAFCRAHAGAAAAAAAAAAARARPAAAALYGGGGGASSSCAAIRAAASPTAPRRSEPPTLCRNIPRCAVAVEGIPANSVSPTDIWFLTGSLRGMFPTGRAVMKIWADARSPGAADAGGMWESVIPEALGLEYERRVYRRIVDPLMRTRRCTAFVQMLADGVRCTFDTLLSVLQAGFPSKPEPALRAALHSNVRAMSKLPRSGSERVSIQDAIAKPSSDALTPDAVFEQERTEYSYILLSAAPKSAVDLTKVFVDLERPRLSRRHLSLLFSLSFALLALAVSKTSHHDMHLGNAFVVPLPTPQRRTYVVDGHHYTHVALFDVFVFDFDRAHSVALGTNWLLEENLGIQLNEFTASLDFVKLFGYVYGCTSGSLPLSKTEFVVAGAAAGNVRPPIDRVQTLVIDLLLRQPAAFDDEDFLHRIYVSGCHLKDKVGETPPRDVRQFIGRAVRTPHDIFRNLAHIVCVPTTAADVARGAAGAINRWEFSALTGLLLDPASAPALPRRVSPPPPLAVVPASVALAARKFAAAAAAAPESSWGAIICAT
jgi:hypothetical protein